MKKKTSFALLGAYGVLACVSGVMTFTDVGKASEVPKPIIVLPSPTATKKIDNELFYMPGIEDLNQDNKLKVAVSRGLDRDELARKINAVLKGKLVGLGNLFVKHGFDYDVSPCLLAAIAVHESENGTSKMIITQNNCGGMYDSKTETFITYKTIDRCIKDMALTVKNIIRDLGKENKKGTIDTIGDIYCPEGALNDPKGLNKHWKPKVTYYYKQILNK